MDILAGLKDKLRFIERFYRTASEPFHEIKRKIEGGEDPYIPPPFDPETATDFDPPFLSDWQEADEGLNLVGQAALNLVQSAFREYLDGYISMRVKDRPAGKGNWFERYRQFFRERFGIAWEDGPVSLPDLEEINFARNDIQHSGDLFGLTRRQSEEHHARFPLGLFVDEIDRFKENRLTSGPVELT